MFFEDKDLKITCEAEWKQSNIEKINFTLNGKGDTKYQILDINPCRHRKGYKFYMIHLLEKKGIADNQEYEASRNTHLVGLKLKKSNHTVVFHFNLYPEPPGGPIVKKCKFSGETMETKEGSIIIGA